jgi:hypothetical protein
MPDQNQLDHEKFTAEKIVTLCDEGVRFERFGDPGQREPDVLFSGRPTLGIEITTAYYEGDADDPHLHAREDWRFARNPQFDTDGIHRIIDPRTGRPKVWDQPVERLTSSCQRALKEKCIKYYLGVDRVWLGIYADAPVTESFEIDQAVEKLSIPETHPFERIFILHVTVERRGGYRALQIFPSIISYLSG